MYQLQPTKSVIDISRRLEEAGFETWCVGGAIRDALLGAESLDWDLATSAKPEQVRDLFGRRRTIPVGIDFGTVSVLDDAGVAHEVTTFRRDVRTDGRHAVVEFGVSLEDDLARRDFTMNAIAFRPSTKEFRDPFNGQADLAARVVRAVGVPAERMREDRLRALRGIRFAARYDFAIDPATRDAIRESAPHMGRLSAERVQQEMVKTMAQVRRPSVAFRLWRDLGAFGTLVPALVSLDDVALATLDRLKRNGDGGREAPQRTTNRMAALFLDCTQAAARSATNALRFSKHDVNWICGIVEHWGTTGREMASLLEAGSPNDLQVRQWHAKLGRLQAGAFLRVAGARWQAIHDSGRSAPSGAAVRAVHRQMRRERHSVALAVPDLAIGGEELRVAGIPAGPIYAKILNSLLQWVIEEPARNSSERLMAELPRMVEMLGRGASQGSSTQQ